MKPAKMALLWATGICGNSLAQNPQPPQVLPPTVIGIPKGDSPVPSGLPIIRKESELKVQERIERFEPTGLSISKVDGRFLMISNNKIIRDFGTDQLAADESLRIMQELAVDQTVTIPGSRPLFQVWLKNGKPPTGVASRQSFFPMIAINIKAESIGGVWVVHDGARVLFDFGSEAESAKSAATILVKHGFNQMGVIGQPRPSVLYPMFDKFTAERTKQVVNTTASLGVLDEVAQKNLILPGNVLAGVKVPLDLVQLQVVRLKTGDWALTNHEEILGRFGSSESLARGALKSLQDSKINQIVRIGTKGIPIFLTDGQAMRGRPLGGVSTHFRPDHLKIQLIRDRWWLMNDSQPMLEAGTKTDAELLQKTLQSLKLTLCVQFGSSEFGGLKLFTIGY